MRAFPPTVFLVACLASAACAELDSDDNDHPGADPNPGAIASDALASVDLPALFARTRRALVEYDGGLRGGDATAGVEVGDRGVTLTPYRWDADFTADEPGAPLALRTTSITRGPRALHDHALVPAPMRTVDGAAELDHGGAVEVIRAVDRGAEQSWRFDAEPAPDLRGDLVVRVAVTGQVYAGRTAGGLHFVDPATGLGFAYSDGVWIDARGERQPVPAVLDHATGEITLTVPGDVVRAAAYPAVLDPTVSAEFGLDTPVLGPSPSPQREPDVSYSGVNQAEYLVVWTDYRREADYGTDVFGARFNMDGDVQELTGRDLPFDGVGDQESPAVAWGDDGPGGIAGHWLVVWSDTKIDNIRGVRIDAQGQPLDMDFDISVPDVTPFESQPAVAFNPTAGQFLVAWKSSSGGLQVGNLAVNSTGAGGIALRTISTDGNAMSPVIATGNPDGSFVVAWTGALSGNEDIFSIRVAANLATTGSLQQITTNAQPQRAPAIAFVPGRGYIVVWEDFQAGDADIRGSILTTAGTRITTATTSIAIGAGSQMTPAIATWDTEALITWGDTGAGRVGNIAGRLAYPEASGVFVFSGSTPIAIAPSTGIAEAPAVTANPGDGQYMVVWHGLRTGSFDQRFNIFGARVGIGTGNVTDTTPLLLGTSYDQQIAPAIASCNGVHLAVWAANPGNGQSEIIGSMIDSASPPNVLVPRIVISSLPVWQGLPAVACSGVSYYVAWASDDGPPGTGRNIQGVVLNTAGAIVTWNNVTAATGTQTEPSVAYLGSNFQIAWADRRSGDYDIWGRRVTSGGSLFTATNLSGAAPGDQIRPDVVGYTTPSTTTSPAIDRYYVAWQDGRNLSTTGWNIRARHIDLLTAAISTDILVNTSAGHQTAPSTAMRPPIGGPFGGSQVLVAYETLNATRDIAVTSIASGGGLSGAYLIAASPYYEERAPDLAHRTGSQLVLAYERNSGVFGQDLDASPAVSPLGAAFVISDEIMYIHDVRESSPAIACATTARCLTLYQRYADVAIDGWETQYEIPGVDRVRMKALSY